MDVWSQNEEKNDPSRADKPGLNPLQIPWCNLNKKKKPSFFYIRKLLRGMFRFFVFFTYFCVLFVKTDH